MKISIITLFPRFFEPFFSTSILKRAQATGNIEFNIVDLRQFGEGKHKIVDDRPYGGGIGMVLKVDILDRAILATKLGKGKEIVALLDPKGKQFSQSIAEEYSRIDHLILLCGHYEGVDERIRNYIDTEISIGDYVLSGGELAAMVVTDSVARLVPGVLKHEDATNLESFTHISGKNKRVLEYPQYTRPKSYRGESVPEILLSGDFVKIEKYRINEAKKLTKERRPDLVDEK